MIMALHIVSGLGITTIRSLWEREAVIVTRILGGARFPNESRIVRDELHHRVHDDGS